jgi:hypothetical protein
VAKGHVALPLDANDRAIYRQCTNRENPPTVAPNEVYMVSGRKSGKSFIFR